MNSKPWSIAEIYAILHDRPGRLSLHEGSLVVNGLTFCPQSMAVSKSGQFVISLRCLATSEEIAERLYAMGQLVDRVRSVVA
jgi:hypothetical protein